MRLPQPLAGALEAILRPEPFVLTETLFLRLLGLVYLIAFASLWPQVVGLIGSEGIVSASQLLTSLHVEGGISPARCAHSVLVRYQQQRTARLLRHRLCRISHSRARLLPSYRGFGLLGHLPVVHHHRPAFYRIPMGRFAAGSGLSCAVCRNAVAGVGVSLSSLPPDVRIGRGEARLWRSKLA